MVGIIIFIVCLFSLFIQIAILFKDYNKLIPDRVAKTKRDFIIMLIPLGGIYIGLRDVLKDVTDYYKELN